jgi:membrane protein
VRETFEAFLEDSALHWGAALAYYSLISLAPLVVLGMTLLGKIAGTGQAEAWILGQVRLLSGPRGVDLARSVLEEASRPELGSLAAVLAVLLLLLGATAVFVNLQNSLNEIWRVRAVSGFIKDLLRARLSAFLMVLALGGMILTSALVSTLVNWAGPLLDPLDSAVPFVRLADTLVSFVILWVFVAASFWLLPDAKVAWRDVWIGALATAVLLILGKLLLATFLARHSLGSLYGTAGSILLLMMWVYFSTQVLLLGAEFTKVWARSRGREIQPESYAVRVETVAVSNERDPAREV